MNASLLLIVATSLVSFVCGLVGFHISDPGSPFLTKLYLTLQLFTFQAGDIDGPVPIPLEIARWLAPATTLGSLFAAARSYFHGVWGRIRLLFVRDHTIICGGGSKGSLLAEELVGREGLLVVIEKDPANLALASLRKKGAVVLAGDAGFPDVLKEARIHEAKTLVCLAGDDRTNLGIAMAAAGQVDVGRANNPLQIHVHIADVAHRNILQRNRALDITDEKHHQIRTFNYFTNRARVALKRLPLNWESAQGLAKKAKLIVGSVGPLERAILVQAAHIGHFPDGERVSVYLLSSTAEVDKKNLVKDYPGFEICAPIQAIKLESATDFSEAVAKITEHDGPEALTTVLMTDHEVESAFVGALLLSERLRGAQRYRIVLDAPDHHGIKKVLQTGHDDRGRKLSSFIELLPGVSTACGHEAVFSESLDTIAIKIHDTWFKETQAKIATAEKSRNHEEAKKHRAKATFKPWPELSEEQKDANRLAADHLETKVRSVGLDPKDPELVSAWKNLSTDDLDMLSRMEHERWAAPYWMAGWQKGPRDDSRRLHPNLIAYDVLDEGTQKYDRDQVLKTAEYLYR
jgi:hypothetical protein